MSCHGATGEAGAENLWTGFINVPYSIMFTSYMFMVLLMCGFEDKMQKESSKVQSSS